MNAQRRPEEPQCDDEATRAAIREAKRRRMLERSEQACRAGAVQRDPMFVEEIDAKLEELAAAMADVPEGEGKKARRAAKVAQARVREIEQELAELRQAEQDQIRLYGDAADRIIAMKARGEDVDAYEAETADLLRDEHGAVVRHKTGARRGMPVLTYDRGLRAKIVSGLDWLLSKRRLTERQHQAGERYGEDYRKGCDVSIKSCIAGGVRGGEPVLMAEERMSAQDRINDARRYGLCSHNELIELCDAVCGQGMKIRALAGGQDQVSTAKEAILVVALDLLANHYRNNCA